ncbi:ABC transporter substrate-binding protein [Candidimonas nitroreducens]|nr:ABC transporter substrate-binding protein [Candidimonas nitroreducens]
MKSIWKVAACSFLVLMGTGTVFAQKMGGTLRTVVRDNPPSASIQEEGTSSTVIPFMPVFNNLVLFDQSSHVNEITNIKPDLADSWRWSEDQKTLTFKLHPGVKWHDGKPFTSADVQCTWDTLRGKRNGGWRKNPRGNWYQNLDMITTNGDLEVSFHLKRPQPSFLVLLASGYSPVYPCHVDGPTMRTHPIGTGPFKLAEYRRNQVIRLVRNPDYFKKGKPYLDAIEYRVISNQGTRNLAFVSGEVDLTWAELDVDGAKGIKARQPEAICDLGPQPILGEVLYNPKDATMSDERIRRAIALAIDRQAFNSLMASGKVVATGIMLPKPAASWGLSPDQVKDLPGYGPDVAANREQARKLMAQAGYGPDHHLSATLMVVNRPTHVTPATLLADQLRSIYIDTKLDPVDISVERQRLAQRSGYQFNMLSAAPAVDDPDSVLFQDFGCKSPGNFGDYCDAKTQAMIEEQSRMADVKKRAQLVHEIDRRIVKQAVRPVVYTGYLGACRYPYVKNVVRAYNSVYNNSRLEDVWLDKRP